MTSRAKRSMVVSIRPSTASGYTMSWVIPPRARRATSPATSSGGPVSVTASTNASGTSGAMRPERRRIVRVGQGEDALAEPGREREPRGREREEVRTLGGEASHDRRPHHVARRRPVLVDADVQPGHEVDPAGIAPRPARALVHRLPEEVEQRRRDASLHDGAVGDPPGHAAARGSLRGDVDRHRGPARGEVEPALVEGDLLTLDSHGLTGQEPADQLHRFADGDGGAARVDAELAEATHAGADPEDGAPTGNLVEGGDRHRGERGVAGVGIGHAGAEADSRRAKGQEGERRVDLAEEALVGEPEGVVAERLGARGQGHELLRRPRREQQEAGPEGHPVASPRRARATFSAVIGRLVMRTPAAAATALATAAGGSMFGGSPTPLAPYGPTRLGCWTRID